MAVSFYTVIPYFTRNDGIKNQRLAVVCNQYEVLHVINVKR